MRSLRELFDLHGRVALVTGGAGHIGSAIADALAELGAQVAVLDTQPTPAQRALALAVDLEDEASVRGVPDRVVHELGSLEIVVNCAALVGTSGLSGWAVPIAEQSAASFRRALEVNLVAPFVLTQAAVPHLAARGRGTVINVLSIYGLVGPDERLYEGTPLGNPSAYGASKAALMQLTRHFATTLAPAVRVNALTPGGVERGQAQAFRERYVARTPLGRMAVEEDFKGAAAFLASDASSYVTGQNVVVDGGWTSW